MRRSSELDELTGLASRFGAFVAERHPLALADALEAFAAVTRGGVPSDEPVSTMTQWVMCGRTESRQRRITCASFLTIMLRQRLFRITSRRRFRGRVGARL